MVTLMRGLAYWQNHEMVGYLLRGELMLRFVGSHHLSLLLPDRLQYGLLHRGKSCLQTAFLSWRAAMRAASLQTLAISAPEKP